MTANLFDLTPADLSQVRAEAKKERHRASLVGRMVLLHGRGPDGAICGGCRHLRRTHAGKYLKCALGPQSNGPATDWRAGWAACGKFGTFGAGA